MNTENRKKYADNLMNNEKSQPILESGLILNDRYEIIRILGKGSFGETYLALDKTDSLQVAIKVFHPEKAETWKSYELFEREVKVLQMLKHPGIPLIFDFFEHSKPTQSTCIVMEYIEGELLQDMVSRGYSFDPTTIVDLFIKLLDILDYLHTRVPPVLHRDIKPSNIIIKKDFYPILIDFGSVRTLFKAADEKGSTIIGTYGYMPYEQYMGQASPSSDLYSLAATFIEVMTGRAPSDFINDDGAIIIPTEMSGPVLLRQVMTRMLASSVSVRFQSARDVKKQLFSPIISDAEHSLVVSGRSELVPAGEDTSTISEDKETEIYNTHYAPNWKKLLCMNSQGELPVTIKTKQLVTLYVFSIFSLGIAPLSAWLYQRHLEKKYKPFFERGKLTRGKIDKMFYQQRESSSPKYRVLYSFEVDGVLHRSALVVRPSFAQLLRENSAVYILYLPDENFRSIILGER